MFRFRRLRQSSAMRDMVCETQLYPKDFIYPLFIIEGENIKESVESMPGVYRYSIDLMDEILEKIDKSGISGVLLFGVPEHKDPMGTEAYNENGIIQRAIRHIKQKYPNMVVIADICLCEYTSHGHCGVIEGEHILNDETLPLLAKMAVTTVKAGADMVAPSDMMDGDVAAIRKALDENGFINTPIMGYSAKYSSAYYSPFRDAAGSAPGFGDRKSYQMDFRNGKEGLREIENDINQGADIVMVKPALAYLDVLKAAADKFDYPLAVYNVSGEYAMVKAAALNCWIDERKIVTENLTAMKRAGAKIIITYHALDMAQWLKEEYLK